MIDTQGNRDANPDRPAAARPGGEHGSAPHRPRNRFDRMEWAGAFGDLGTLIPFVVAYISVAKVDPLGVLFAFGVVLMICGAYYRTPFPVQPMKAIGAVVATQGAHIAVTVPAIFAAGLVTGLIWLLLGLSGTAERIGRLVSRPVLMGIILGLGMSFMLEGVKLMAAHWYIAAAGLTGTILLLSSRRVPAMLALLVFGLLCGVLLNPGTLDALATVSMEFRLPAFALSELTWADLLTGTLFLALPQLPLTLGNALLAIREENNRLFPDRPVSDRGVAVSTGLMNLFGSAVGGVPMCHGAGGMAGHVAFGARTGGAPIILGIILLLGALFFSSSVELLLGLLPTAILGVILFITGSQLALGSGRLDPRKAERFITLITAASAIWNVGLAFLLGMLVTWIHRRGWLRL
ncbi:putative sulfate/molybdate transporter [Sedimenticola hydrogenitrophicus]|uniref:putative sulfate/molybdate transporter n=1 Tax=Sedimenticola hydrogenitrophicus TaxID=2967975 RepID=UPI0023B0E407